MYRNLMRKEPEVIAVMAHHPRSYMEWMKETGFVNTPTIYWIYIHSRYQLHGLEITAMFLIGEYWKRPGFGKLFYEIRSRMEDPKRVFSMNE